MKRSVISLVVLAGVGALIALLKYGPTEAERVAQPAAAPQTAAESSVPTPETPAPDATTPAPVPTAVKTPAPTPVPTARGAYRDGTYTGPVVDVGYGPVQVQAVISGGRLSTVRFLQMPSAERQSVQIAGRAEPVLLQEAVQAQSANVDVVSGATADSHGFMQSLGSALAQAKS
jgi:uncharacterized protein with FMN-binding domain